MKKIAYLVSVMSCCVLAYLFISRGQYIWAGLIGILSVFYLWGIINQHKNIEKVHKETSMKAGTGSKADKNEALSQLQEMLKLYRKNMKIFKNASIVGYVLSVIIMFFNVQLAIACYILLTPVAYKFYKNYQAVHLIEVGISKK